MRQLILSPRWIVWHLLTLGAMITCGLLAAWQWHRAGSALGSALNVGYGLQWPVFAIFFGFMWWRMLRMEAAKLREEATSPVPEPDTTQGHTADGGGGTAQDDVSVPAPRSAEPRPATASGGPSPFGPRPRSAVPPPADDDPELAAYNRMLAQLAARHSED